MRVCTRSRGKKTNRRERGQLVVLAAIMLTVVLGFSGLAIDIGLWLHTRTKLQADADAMALAGGQQLPDEIEADLIAREWGTKNGVLVPEIEGVSVNSNSCYTPAPDDDYINVRLTRQRTAFL